MSVNSRGDRGEGRGLPLASFLRTVLAVLGWRFVGLVLVTLLIGLVSGMTLVALIPMLQVAGLDLSAGAGERIAAMVASTFRMVGLQPTLEAVLLLNLLLVGSTAWLTRFQSVTGASLNQELVNRLRRRLYSSIIGADWIYLTKQRASRFDHILLGEVERVGGALSALVSLLVNSGRTLVYALFAMVLSPATTALTLTCGAILSLLMLRRTRLGQARGEAVSGAYERLYRTAREHLDGLRLTKGHGLEEEQARSFGNVADGTASAQVEVVRNHSDLGFWLQVGSAVALAIIVYAALAVLDLPFATVLLLLYLFSRLLPMLGAVQKNYQALANLLPAFSRYCAVLYESEAAREAPMPSGQGFRLREGIELHDVYFGYEEGSGQALRGLHLTIPAGRTTALVGASGAGKSTIADLVIGLVAPDSGRVLVGGEELIGSRRRAWRRQVGYVSQDIFLFHDTIRANLLVARPEASDEELWEALASAAAEFVGRLPDGLDTVVGDRGVRLSGGERQRIALARALLRRPAVLVLDEATSALDAHNEERIREAIASLAGRQTILLIAHRLASVRNAHLIHVVENGEVVESGTWDELWSDEGGRFRALALAQGLGPEGKWTLVTLPAGSLPG